MIISLEFLGFFSFAFLFLLSASKSYIFWYDLGRPNIGDKKFLELFLINTGTIFVLFVPFLTACILKIVFELEIVMKVTYTNFVITLIWPGLFLTTQENIRKLNRSIKLHK